jgi:anti-sigma-K factor RskA
MSTDEDFSDQTPESADAALAGEFVLRLLAPKEHAACATRVETDRAFAAEVARWEAHFAELDYAFAESPPSAALRGRIEKRLFGSSRPSLIARLWSSAGLWRGFAVASAAVAIWFATPVAPPPPPDAPVRRLVAAIAPAQGGAEFLALFDPLDQTLRINRVAGEAAPGRSLELWVIAGEAAPVSLGVLPEDALARLVVPAELAALLDAGATLAVTDEPPGGSPTGGPTGAVQSAGPLREI